MVENESFSDSEFEQLSKKMLDDMKIDPEMLYKEKNINKLQTRKPNQLKKSTTQKVGKYRQKILLDLSKSSKWQSSDEEREHHKPEMKKSQTIVKNKKPLLGYD